jgi:crotonobetainyl-CoA:carnitine CoA-transferase CaiB-like acyl-CoA transferase
VLGLDEALESELVRAREMVATLEQPGVAEPVRLLGVPVSSTARRRSHRGPGPVLASTAEVLRGLATRRGRRRLERRAPWPALLRAAGLLLA